MTKKIFITAFLFAALAVILGAIAAHALENKLTPKMLKTFETAARYQMYHSLAIALCGILFYLFKSKKILTAYKLFAAGIVLFSGSLYTLCLLSMQYTDTYNFLGAITPFGGICFITGWIFLALAIAKTNIE